jgi:hypothetical protein
VYTPCCKGGTLKSLILLWNQVAAEAASWCCTCATRDSETVARRVEREGISFLTITLADFGKDLQKALDLGRVAPDSFLGFKKRAGLPQFLGGFLELVFDRNDGRLLENPSVEAILCLRQLTLMFSKILLPTTDRRERKAFEVYLKCEEEVRQSDAVLPDSARIRFRQMSLRLFGSMCSRLDREVYYHEHVPKHGPGSTAETILGNQKYLPRTWPTRLEKDFPSELFLIPNPRYYDELDKVDFLEPGAEIPVKVISVPKTLKTPRIIAKEPVAMQYAQQALLEGFSRELNRTSWVGLKDQTPNQRLALQGSLYGDLATLDLSEASDRVSNQLVLDLFQNFPHLSGAVQSSRSRKADVPGHGVIRLAKFASMGSAVCFPIEAMVFTTIIFLGIEDALKRPLSRQDLVDLRGKVRVYGDDIIVPVTYVRDVVRSLESFGVRVNEHKSYWNGKFRESCGKDYYDGHDVTPVKVRRVFPVRRRDAQEMNSLVSLRNQLYQAGYWRTAGWLDERIRPLLGGHYPIVEPTSPVMGRWSVLPYQEERTCPELHRPLVKGFTVRARPPIDPIDGPAALLKCLLRLRGHSTFAGADVDHLERSGRPRVVDTKLGWYTPF